MKETGGSKDGRKEEGGNRNAKKDGRKIICLKNGMAGINPGVVAFGQEYCCFLLDQIISL